MTHFGDLLGPQPVKLLVDDEPAFLLEQGKDAVEVAAEFPSSSLAWATLAQLEIARGHWVQGYAYARTGYHRGLDQLRKSGWKGFGPVPWRHEGNQGWLLSVASLAKCAKEIGEEDEYLRCLETLHESDPSQEISEALGLADL